MCKSISEGSDFEFNWSYTCLNNLTCEDEWPCELENFLLGLEKFIIINRFLLFHGTVFLIIVGFFLNTLSFYVLFSSGLSKKGSGLYLLVLSTTDSANLILNYGVGVIRAQITDANEVFQEYNWLCLIHGVCVELFQTLSAWLVVGLTVERCLVVCYPLFMKKSGKKHTKFVIFGLCLFAFLFSLTKLFLRGFEKDSVFGYTSCSNSSGSTMMGMGYIRVSLETIIPTCLVLIINITIIWKLERIKKKRSRLTEMRRPGRVTKKGDLNLNQHQKLTRSVSSSASPMLLTVSLSYLILVFPLGVVQSIELSCPINGHFHEEIRSEYIQRMKKRILLKLIRSLCFAFYQINFAINFFLYYASGVQFRLYLKNCLKKKYTQLIISLNNKFKLNKCFRRKTTTDNLQPHPHQIEIAEKEKMPKLNACNFEEISTL